MSLRVGEGRLGATPDADTDPGRPVWAWHSQTDLTIIPAGDPSLPRHPLATLVCRAQRWPLNWQRFIWMSRWSSSVTHTSHNTTLTTLQLIVRVRGRLGWWEGGGGLPSFISLLFMLMFVAYGELASVGTEVGEQLYGPWWSRSLCQCSGAPHMEEGEK